MENKVYSIISTRVLKRQVRHVVTASSQEEALELAKDDMLKTEEDDFTVPLIYIFEVLETNYKFENE
jgi:hypothetical protein